MNCQANNGMSKPISHPLAFAPRTYANTVYDGAALSSEVFPNTHDSNEASRSFEMDGGVVEGGVVEGGIDSIVQQPQTIKICTIVPDAMSVPALLSSSPSASSKAKLRSAAVHVDPNRTRTVAAAAAARRKSTEEVAAVEPLTAENETWGHWSFRHAWNAVVMLLLGLYQVVQASAQRQPVDMNTITYTNSMYVPAPPRTAELQKQEERQKDSSQVAS